MHRLGGTVVLMKRFDAEDVLAFVKRYRVTHVQMVPTMRFASYSERTRGSCPQAACLPPAGNSVCARSGARGHSVAAADQMLR